MFDFDDEQQQLFNIPIALHKKRSYSAPIQQPFFVSIEQPQLIFNPSNFQSEPHEKIEFNSENYEQWFKKLSNIDYTIDELTQSFNEFFQINPPISNKQFGLFKLTRQHFNKKRARFLNKQTTIYTKIIQ